MLCYKFWSHPILTQYFIFIDLINLLFLYLYIYVATQQIHKLNYGNGSNVRRCHCPWQFTSRTCQFDCWVSLLCRLFFAIPIPKKNKKKTFLWFITRICTSTVILVTFFLFYLIIFCFVCLLCRIFTVNIPFFYILDGLVLKVAEHQSIIKPIVRLWWKLVIPLEEKIFTLFKQALSMSIFIKVKKQIFCLSQICLLQQRC